MRVLAVILLVFTLVVTAAEDNVRNYNNYTLQQMVELSSDCTKSFPKSKLPKRLIIPNGSKLFMVCGYKVTPRYDGGEDLQGGFWFKTNKICSGTVTYESSDAGELSFFPDNKSCSIDGELHSRKNSENYSLEDRNKLKVPVKLPYSCLIAKAKIRVKTYADGFDDVDRGGSSTITDYDVLEVSTYRKCKAQESGFGQVWKIKDGNLLPTQ